MIFVFKKSIPTVPLKCLLNKNVLFFKIGSGARSRAVVRSRFVTQFRKWKSGAIVGAKAGICRGSLTKVKAMCGEAIPPPLQKKSNKVNRTVRGRGDGVLPFNITYRVFLATCLIGLCVILGFP